MTTANPLVKRCYTMSEPHLSGHRVILGFNTMQEAQDAHEFIANIRPSPADAPCQSAGAVAPGECGSVPDEQAAFEAHIRMISPKRLFIERWPDGSYKHIEIEEMWKGWQARASLDMQPPNNQPNSDHVAVISAKPDSDHLAVSSAEPESRVEPASYIDYQQRKGAPLTFFTSVAAHAYAAAATRDDVLHIDAMRVALQAVEDAQSGISSPTYRPNEQNDVVQEGKQ